MPKKGIPALAVFIVALMLTTGLFAVVNQKENAAISAGSEVATLKNNSVGDKADAFFDDSFVHEIRLYFDDANWYETLYNAHQGNSDDTYFPARFVYNNTVLDTVGVRFKGLSSFSGNGEKKPFLIDFNEYQEGTQNDEEHSFFGLKKLNLNNCFSDTSMLREKLFLDFASQYIVVPRAVYTRVYVNDEYLGLYLAVEQIDQTFIESRFGKNEDGNLYKIEASFLNYLGQDAQTYNGTYELKTNLNTGNWSDLIELTKVLNMTLSSEWPAILESVLDVDSTLYSLALLNVFSSLDSYIGSGRNYYLYNRDDTGQFTMLICDFNMAFGGFGGFSSEGANNQTMLDPFYAQAAAGFGQNTLPSNITVGGLPSNRTSPGFPPNATGGFLPPNFTDGFGVMPPFNMTNPLFPQNRTLPEGIQFNAPMPLNNTGVFAGGVRGGFASGEQVLVTRVLGVDSYNRTYLRAMAQILQEGFNFDTMSARIQELANSIREDAYKEPYSASSIWFSRAPNQLQIDTQANMTSAQAFEAGLANLLAFVEERYEFLETRLNEFAQDSDLQLNDLMTQNTKTLADDSGKYEPWLELYNLGPSEVSTAGFFLTDTQSTPNKWALPTQGLSDGEFLLLWLDDESMEGVNHASFSLNPSGGEVFLYKQKDTRYTLIDSVSYPALDVDVSYSRFPDGTGLWYKIGDRATPSASNQVSEGTVLVPGKLYINELMADNDGAVEGPSGSYPDWVELYNGGDYLIDLSGMYLTDDLTNPSWRFPDGAYIEPGSYLLIWADGNSGKGPLHANFRLRANGGTLGLFASDGKTLIDSILFDKQLRDVSYGRTTDGSLIWTYFTNPTAGAANKVSHQNIEFADWSIWVFIIIALAVCVAVVLLSKIKGGRNS